MKKPKNVYLLTVTAKVDVGEIKAGKIKGMIAGFKREIENNLKIDLQSNVDTGDAVEVNAVKVEFKKEDIS